MKPVHSKASIKLYPAPTRDEYPNIYQYASACQRVEALRIRYDQANPFEQWVLRLIGKWV